MTSTIDRRNYLPARRKLGVVTQIGHWRFVIHYTDCSSYLRSNMHNRCLPVTPGMRLKVCAVCSPNEAEIEPFLKLIPINPYSHGWHHPVELKAIEG